MSALEPVAKAGEPTAGAASGAPLNPGRSAEQLLEQGMALEQQGQPEEALLRYDSAIALMPELARAHFNRGTILLDRGDAQQALEAFTKAVQYKPDSAGAHFNLGAAYSRLDQHEAAMSAYRQALSLKPDFAEAEMALGAALEEQGRDEEAVRSYRRALEIQPGYAEAQDKLAYSLVRLDQFDEAAACFRRILVRDPHNVEALNSLGLLLNIKGQFHEAVSQYRLAVKLKPDFLAAHGNLGNVLMDLHQFSDAAASYHRVLELNPDSADAYNNLGSAFKDLGDLDKALASYRKAMTLKPDLLVAHSNLLMVQNYLSEQPPQELVEEARRFGETAARLAPPVEPLDNSPMPDRCLRIGIVSADLSAHPVGYFIESILAALVAEAAGRLELFAYANSSQSDEVTARIKSHLQGWHPAHDQSDESLAQRIRDDRIDILIDLSGHTGGNRLPVFERRPAPVQISWLGYFATTGVPSIDYLVADPWTLPSQLEQHFTEKILRLPETRLCFTPPTLDLNTGPLPALANGYVTFACFNALPKMGDAVVALWARILQAVPGSRLHLMASQLSEASTRQTTLERFMAHGIDATRLLIQGPMPRIKYLQTYQRVDIALDPFPYTGGTTTAEALWMGVPVLTLAGNTFLSRQGVGLLMNAGLSEWIASDADDYVKRAVAHAGDLQKLSALRSSLRPQVMASPLFDAPRFARHFEAALRGVWHRWCAQARSPSPRPHIEEARDGKI
ncbi:putative O-linked N-acetylglucosamine transferase, SPINDLY family [Polaromonas sp. CF318]|uniref:tetratricopeptide repeat protein n=1 Tax=Polaromonas sp. CF318 TaxID=1144318 RepID=UPI0002714C86|nr:tetratricopeptide repeat protein [Polaromonas sp. CF318]EJL82730.1 putative O-linked N-acetylglucosamine transferase, SPINDLY family [Polaromonas sp. CF318]